MRVLTAVAFVSAITAIVSPADAYRPFDGTDAEVVEPKVFEIELGPVYYYRQATQNYLITPAVVLNLGLFEQTELVIDIDQYVAVGKLDADASRVRVVGDDVFLKHVFREGTIQGKTGLSIAGEGGMLIPEINGAPAFGASLDIITSYRWSWGAIHWNEWFEITRERHADLFTGIILEGPHDWTVRPVAEMFYDKDFAGDQAASALAGAIWTVRESLSFDVGVRCARKGDDNVGEVRLGLTWAVSLGGQAAKASARARSRSFRPSG